MKTQNQFFLLTAFFIFFSSTLSFGQIRAGVKVAPGFGFIKSRNLKKIYQRLEDEHAPDEKVTRSATSRVGTHLGFGGFVDYKYSEDLFFMAEPMFVYSTNQIIINSRVEKLNDKGTGSVTNITSEAKFRASYFSLPLSVKYRFNERKEYYILAGLAFNFHFTPILRSKEQEVVLGYLANEAFETSRTQVEYRIKMREYKIFNANFFIGAGKVLNPYGRNIIVDVRYNLPISKSPMYAKGSAPDNMLLNSVYTEEGKNNLNTVYPQYPLKDFRMGVLQFSVAVSLYKNYR